MEISYSYLKENFSYILGYGNPEKILYISGNGTFLYFRKQKHPEKFHISHGTELFSISGGTFKAPKNQNFLYFSKKSYA